MGDINKNRAKVDFNDSALSSSSPASLIFRRGEGRDIRKKDVSSLSRRRSKGLRVTNSLSSGAIISPGRPTRVLVPAVENDKYNKQGTSKLIKDIEEEVEEVLEVDLEYIKILNQTQLKPIYPLGKCTLMIGTGKNASIVCRNQIIDCFDFNLGHSLDAMYFRKEKEFLYGEFVVIYKDKRQLTRKDLNLANPDVIPPRSLPKFDKVWFKTSKSVSYTKFHELALHTDLKVFHDTINGMNSLFISTTSPSQFYGDNSPKSTLLKARRERAADNEPIIDTKPRTRSMAKPPPDKLNTLETAEVIAGEDDQHENIDEMDQIRFLPDLNFKFEDKRTFTITNADFKCLYNNYWINDNLIDFFLKLSLENSIRQSHIKADQVLLLNSFFFTKLVKNENFYENVKSWFKDNRLFSYRYVIIPVNQDLHWYCLIIHNLDRVYNDLKDEDVSIEDDDNLIEIFILDSLSQDHKSIKAPLVNFLTDYAKDKYGINVTAEKFKMYISPIPKQENFNDCGIHVIYNINIFLNKTDEFQEIWKKSRKKFKNNKRLFLLADRQKLRMKLREDLIELLRSQERENGQPDYEKIGKLTNKDFDDADSKAEEEVEEYDSDFEILGSIIEDQEDEKEEDVNDKDHEMEDEIKSKYFLENHEFPSSTDSALIQDKMIDSAIEKLESEVLRSKAEKARRVSAGNQEKSSSEITQSKGTLNFEDFYASLLDSDLDIDVDVSSIAKYAITDMALTFFQRLLNYLTRFEKNMLHEEKFSKDLKLLMRYFNSLKEEEVPDREVMESFFDQFLEIHKGVSSNTSNDDDESQDSEPRLETPVKSSEPSTLELGVQQVKSASDSQVLHEIPTASSPVQKPNENISAFLKINNLKNNVALPTRKLDNSELIDSSSQEQEDLKLEEPQEEEEEEIVSSDLSEVNSDRVIAIDGDETMSISKITKTINISDSEDYENFNNSVSANRERFMSKFPLSSDDNIEAVDERKLVQDQIQADDGSYKLSSSPPSARRITPSRRRNDSKSIFNLLPIVNRSTVREDAQTRSKSHKKQKVESSANQKLKNKRTDV